MDNEFGAFLEKKRKEKNLTLRGLATALGIAPAYLSDIEKGHRYPPDKDRLFDLVTTLSLSINDANYLYDLAARAKENTVPVDLPDYIMNNEMARVALRKARDNHVSDKTWKKIIDIIDDKKIKK